MLLLPTTYIRAPVIHSPRLINNKSIAINPRHLSLRLGEFSLLKPDKLSTELKNRFPFTKKVYIFPSPLLLLSLRSDIRDLFNSKYPVLFPPHLLAGDCFELNKSRIFDGRERRRR